jgi:hypothetical protein
MSASGRQLQFSLLMINVCNRFKRCKTGAHFFDLQGQGREPDNWHVIERQQRISCPPKHHIGHAGADGHAPKSQAQHDLGLGQTQLTMA